METYLKKIRIKRDIIKVGKNRYHNMPEYHKRRYQEAKESKSNDLQLLRIGWPK